MLHEDADVLAGFGVAGLSALGLVVLMRRPAVSRPGDDARA